MHPPSDPKDTPPAWTSSSSCTSSMGRSLTPDCRDLRRAASTPHARTGFNMRTLNEAPPQTDDYLNQMTTSRQTERECGKDGRSVIQLCWTTTKDEQPKDGNSVIQLCWTTVDLTATINPPRAFSFRWMINLRCTCGTPHVLLPTMVVVDLRAPRSPDLVSP